jgi:hypothetical protein
MSPIRASTPLDQEDPKTDPHLTNAVGNVRTTPGHHPGGTTPSREQHLDHQRPTLWSAGCVGTRTSRVRAT